MDVTSNSVLITIKQCEAAVKKVRVYVWCKCSVKTIDSKITIDKK